MSVENYNMNINTVLSWMLCLGLGNYQKIDVTVFQNCLKFILFREFWNISNKPNYAFSLYIYFYLFIFYFYFFACFRASPAAYGSSQARVWIGAAATANTGSEPCLWPIPQLHYNLQPHLNPPSEARDRTCILPDTSWVLHPLSHSGTS